MTTNDQNGALEGEYSQRETTISTDVISKYSLHQAAREGNVADVRKLLDRSTDQQVVKKTINERDEEKCAPLHYAARYHHLECVKTLVERHANVNIRGPEGMTPLHFAAHYLRPDRRSGQQPPPAETTDPETAEDVEEITPDYGSTAAAVANGELPRGENETFALVEFLVSKHADINCEDDYGLTPLHYAARRDNYVTAEALLACKTSIEIDSKDKQQQTPLHAACTYDHYRIVQLLIRRAAVNASDKQKCTPLMLACMNGNKEIVTALFDAVESEDGRVKMASHTDSAGMTPLHCAVVNKHHEIAVLCIEKGSDVNALDTDGNTPLHLAAIYGYKEITELLVTKVAHIEAINHERMSPLHLAAQYGHAALCTLLINKGAWVDRKEVDNYTPLLLAAVNGHEFVLRTLLEEGADVSCKVDGDKTAIFLAAEEDKLEALKVLLEDPDVVKKKLINQCDQSNNSPLHVAAEKGHERVVKFLLKKKAVKNLKNEKERTPIHMACGSGRINVVNALLAHDDNCVHDKDEHNNTPLHLAAFHGHAKVAKALIEAGTWTEVRNVKSLTPLHCAAAEGWVKTARVLLDHDSSIDKTDNMSMTPLLLASKNGHKEVVALLLQEKATVSLRNTDELNCLDLAIDNNHEDVALAIVNSDKWVQALRNENVDPATGVRSTPMRKLIRKMPGVAERVFDRCTTKSDHPPNDLDYCISYNCEFLDDVYQNWNRKGIVDDALWRDGNAYDDEGNLKRDAKPYTEDKSVVKSNHPLMIMVSSKRENLLVHPLVTSLLRHKWNSYARYIYYTNLAMYLVFLAILTAYIVITKTPAQFYSHTDITIWSSCEDIMTVWKGLGQTISSMWWETTLKYSIIVLCLLQLLRELLQIYQAKLNYLGPENLIEWTMYVFSIYLVIDQNDCQKETNLRDYVQWQVGAIAIFLAWIELVLFIRKLPMFGIYIVMFTDVLNTFIRFSLVFFLFIIAFALSFHVLMANQIPFDTVGSALLKTSVMMIGEFEFDTLFNTHRHAADGGDHETQVYFYIANYIVFVMFLVVMSIILMNLLVGLAVDGIKAVQDQAVLKRLAMRVELAFEVEQFVPDFIRRRFAKLTHTMSPNKKRNKIVELVLKINLDGQTEERQELQRLENMIQKMRDELETNVKKIVRILERQMERDNVQYEEVVDLNFELGGQ